MFMTFNGSHLTVKGEGTGCGQEDMEGGESTRSAIKQIALRSVCCGMHIEF